MGPGGCRFLKVLDLFAIREVCHGRRLGVSRGQTHDLPPELSGDGGPDGTVEDNDPSIQRCPLRGATSRRLQNRAADAITAFTGSMMGFVYLHVIWFVLWLKVEPFKHVFPYGLLTMIVSLEAIFLSTFVMIS